MALPATYFVTGTDTDAGKTFVTCSMLQSANKKGLKTAAIKPLAAGAELYAKQSVKELQNEDALLLQKHCSLTLSYSEINPVCLRQAIAPHIAAENEKISVHADDLARHCQQIIAKGADLTLIEGAGGWRVPLNQQEFVGDIVKGLDIPVILVVGMKLGCLNHALLTEIALAHENVRLHGWIANQLDPDMTAFHENLETLQTRLKAPLLASIPWSAQGDLVEMSLDWLE